MAQQNYSLYLMKGEVLLGTVVNYSDGYRFFPNNARHKASRKAHPSASKAIPRWADKMSTDLLSAEDFKALMSKRNSPCPKS